MTPQTETTQSRASLLGSAAQLLAGDSAEASASDEILTQAEAARLVRLSIRSVQRLDEEGCFVPRVQLSSRRVGYWKRDLLAWLAARTAPAKAGAV